MTPPVASTRSRRIVRVPRRYTPEVKVVDGLPTSDVDSNSECDDAGIQSGESDYGGEYKGRNLDTYDTHDGFVVDDDEEDEQENLPLTGDDEWTPQGDESESDESDFSESASENEDEPQETSGDSDDQMDVESDNEQQTKTIDISEMQSEIPDDEPEEKEQDVLTMMPDPNHSDQETIDKIMKWVNKDKPQPAICPMRPPGYCAELSCTGGVACLNPDHYTTRD